MVQKLTLGLHLISKPWFMHAEQMIYQYNYILSTTRKTNDMCMKLASLPLPRYYDSDGNPQPYHYFISKQHLIYYSII